MQKRIVIYLSTTTLAYASWVILDTDNTILQCAENASMEELPALKEYDVYVIVPAQDVLLTQATLPKLSHSRLLQALPFALEEQLITDITELHFAIGKYTAEGTLAVAVVSQQKMLEWLTFFETRGVTPHAFISEVFILPCLENTWHINTYQNKCLVRTGENSGFACEEVNLTTLLELKQLEELPDTAPGMMHTEFSTRQLLETIATEIATWPAINLLQGNYQPKPPTSKVRKTWLLACYLAIAWISILFIGDMISYAVLHKQEKKLTTQINQIYRRNFPHATSVVAPRSRMEEKLRTASGLAAKNNFLGLLSGVAKSLSQAPGIHIQNLDFREQQMTLEISAASFDNLDVFTRALLQEHLTVKQQSATEAGTQVKATLLIHAGAT